MQEQIWRSVPCASELRLLLACARQRFDHVHRHEVLALGQDAALRWQLVFSAAAAHGVAPLVYANLRSCGALKKRIPEEVHYRFKRATLQTKAAKQRADQALAAVLDFCNRHGLDILLLKGAALDRTIYTCPWQTSSLDVDLVVRQTPEEIHPETRLAFDRLIKELSVHCRIELEWFAHHDITMNGVLPVSFAAVWRDARSLPVGNHRAFVMAPEDALIAACINCCRRRFLKLKALCDVAETVARRVDLDWSAVARKSESYNCSRIVYAALTAAQRTVGCPVTGEALVGLRVGRARTWLIQVLCNRLRRPLLAGKTLKAERTLDWTLLLPYASFSAFQLWRNLGCSFGARYHRDTG